MTVLPASGSVCLEKERDHWFASVGIENVQARSGRHRMTRRLCWKTTHTVDHTGAKYNNLDPSSELSKKYAITEKQKAGVYKLLGFPAFRSLNGTKAVILTVVVPLVERLGL